MSVKGKFAVKLRARQFEFAQPKNSLKVHKLKSITKLDKIAFVFLVYTY